MDILYSAVKLLYRECTNDGRSAAPPGVSWVATDAALTYSHCTTAPNGCTALGDTAICWTMHNLGVSRNTSDHLIHNLLNTFASCHTFLLGRRKGWVCIKYLVIANPPPLLSSSASSSPSLPRSPGLPWLLTSSVLFPDKLPDMPLLNAAGGDVWCIGPPCSNSASNM